METGSRLSSGDFNGDGIDDLVFNSASVLYGAKNPKDWEVVLGGGSHDDVHGVGDYNGDGRLDWFVTSILGATGVLAERATSAASPRIPLVVGSFT